MIGRRHQDAAHGHASRNQVVDDSNSHLNDFDLRGWWVGGRLRGQAHRCGSPDSFTFLCDRPVFFFASDVSDFERIERSL